MHCAATRRFALHREGLRDLPVGHWVIQRFLNHDARMYKVYVLGDRSDVVTKVVRLALCVAECSSNSMCCARDCVAY